MKARFRYAAENTIAWNSQQVVIDLGFEDLLTDKETKRLKNQLNLLYGSGSSSACPLRVQLCSMTETFAKEMNSISGFRHWKADSTAQNPAQLHPATSLVYLSPDSPNVLGPLDPARVYVVAGIVDDSNRLPGASADRAAGLGVTTARLPLELAARRLHRPLAVNHVWELLQRCANGCGWSEAFDQVLPQRTALGPGAQFIGPDQPSGSSLALPESPGSMARSVDCPQPCGE